MMMTVRGVPCWICTATDCVLTALPTTPCVVEAGIGVGVAKEGRKD